MGLAAKITNAHDRKTYWVSTIKNPLGIWETVVFERGVLGVPKKGICGVCPLTPNQVTRVGPRAITSPKLTMGKDIVFIPVTAIADDNIREIHAMVVEVATDQPRERWHAMFRKAASEYLGGQGLFANLPAEAMVAAALADTTAAPAPSDSDLRVLARQGQVADALLLALARDVNKPLSAPDFEAHLKEQFQQEGTRALMRYGYRMRIAEESLFGHKQRVPLGQVDKILRTDKTPSDKITNIVEYFDSHDAVGLGDPIRLYTIAPFHNVRQAFDDFVGRALETNNVPSQERDLQAELYHRFLSYGYEYRVAEGLVGDALAARLQEQGTPSDPDDVQSVVADFVKTDVTSDHTSWEPFYDKANTGDVLREKAHVVAALIDGVLDAGLSLASGLKDENSGIRLGDDEALKVYAETAALFLRVVDEMAFQHLGAQDRDGFMDVLEEDVIQKLADRGVGRVVDEQTFSDRQSEYASYREWTAEEGKSLKGTLFWEYAKKVADILGVGPNAIFNVLLMRLLMKSLARWNLPQLLRGGP